MNDTPGLDSVQEAAEAAGREPIGDPPPDDDDEDDEDDENEEPPDDEPEDGELSPQRSGGKAGVGFCDTAPQTCLIQVR